MKFLENDLEEIIYQTDNHLLNDRGLNIRGKKYRQLRIGNYGIADVVTAERDGEILTITVYELKKDKAGISAFLQAIRYAKGIKTYLKKRKFSGYVFIKVVLIAKKIDTTSDYIFVESFMDCLSNYSFSYSIDGIYFEKESRYDLTKNGFKL
jgi:RecB family endonuclease NucS